jgi:hypothetical protein
MNVTWAGIIITARMNEKNACLSFQLYATRAYAVSDEKYTVHTVAPVDIIIEFTKPTSGLKVLPSSTLTLFIKYFEGTKDNA